MNHIDNLVLCCLSCNTSKNSKHLTDWLDSKYCKENKISLKKIKKWLVFKPYCLK